MKILLTLLFVLTLSACSYATSALSLYGQGDYVNFTSPTSASTTTLTLEAWFRTVEGGGYIVGDNDNNDLRMSSGILECRINDGITLTDLNSSIRLDDGVWHHVVCVRNGTSGTLWVDGVSDDTQSGLGSGSASYTFSKLGQRGSSEAYFRGALNGVAMYASALDSTAVAARYNGGVFTALTNTYSMVAGYNCTEGTGTTLDDVSSNNKDGSVVGTAGVRWVADRDRTAVTTWYASTTGSLANSGTSGSPWDIDTIFSHPGSMIAGDTIQLAAGTYTRTSTLYSYLTGTSGSRITVRGPDSLGTYPLTVKIDCAGITAHGAQRCVQINGGYSDFWDLEVFNSNPDKVSSQVSSGPDDIANVIGIWVEAGNIGLYYPKVHDNSGVGIAAYDPPDSISVYGAIGYNNGWRDTSGGNYGMTIYTHNHNPSSSLTFGDTIAFNDYNYAFQHYVSEYDQDSYNLTIDGYFFANRTMVIVGAAPKHNFALSNFDGYKGGVGIGSADEDNYDITVNNLYIYSDDAPIVVRPWRNITFTNNTIVTTSSGMTCCIGSIAEVGGSLPTATYSNNAYYPGPSPTLLQAFVRYNQDSSVDSYLTWANWNALGLDTSGSTFNTGSGGLPTSNSVRYYPDDLTNGRGIFTVWNWSAGSTISVNLSNFSLVNGQPYTIYNSQQPDTAFTSGTYNSSSPSISLSTTSNGVASRVNDSGTTPAATLPNFGIFMLIPGTAPAPSSGTKISGKVVMKGVRFQ